MEVRELGSTMYGKVLVPIALAFGRKVGPPLRSNGDCAVRHVFVASAQVNMKQEQGRKLGVEYRSPWPTSNQYTDMECTMSIDRQRWFRCENHRHRQDVVRSIDFICLALTLRARVENHVKVKDVDRFPDFPAERAALELVDLNGLFRLLPVPGVSTLRYLCMAHRKTIESIYVDENVEWVEQSSSTNIGFRSGCGPRHDVGKTIYECSSLAVC